MAKDEGRKRSRRKKAVPETEAAEQMSLFSMDDSGTEVTGTWAQGPVTPEEGPGRPVERTETGAAGAEASVGPEAGDTDTTPEEVGHDAPAGTGAGTSPAGGASDTGEATGVAPEPPAGSETPGEERTPWALGDVSGQVTRSPLERATRNVEALWVLAQHPEDDDYSQDEVERLAAFSGWGGAADAFREDLPEGGRWRKVHDRLRLVATDDEYAEARSSVLTAFYTPSSVVTTVWQALDGAGVFGAGHAQVLDAGCGTANWVRAMPETLAGRVRYHGIEADRTSAKIAQAVTGAMGLGSAEITAERLERCQVGDGGYDVAVGNVPFSNDVRVELDGTSLALHDYFLLRETRALRPGGVAALVTSSFTLDKRDESVRREVARSCDLLGAVRLPTETFEDAAGTSVSSDLLILRRRGAGEEPPDGDPDWVSTTEVDGVTVNAWLAGHPEAFCGWQTNERNRYGELHAVCRCEPGEVAGRLATALRTELADVHDLAGRMGAREHSPIVSRMPYGGREYDVTLGHDGTVWYSDGHMMREAEFGSVPDAKERVQGLVRLRDMRTALLGLERANVGPLEPLQDLAVQGMMGSLKAAYDEYVGRFGRLCERANRKALKDRAALLDSVWSLEVTDAEGAFVREADIMRTRVVAPHGERPREAATARDALAISVDETGGVSLGRIAGLLGCDEGEAERRLGDLVVRDPDSGNLVQAEEYLSGDVAGKLEHVRELAAAERTRAARDATSAWRAEEGIDDDSLAMMVEELLQSQDEEVDNVRHRMEGEGHYYRYGDISRAVDAAEAARMRPWVDETRKLVSRLGEDGMWACATNPDGADSWCDVMRYTDGDDRHGTSLGAKAQGLDAWGILDAYVADRIAAGAGLDTTIKVQKYGGWTCDDPVLMRLASLTERQWKTLPTTGEGRVLLRMAESPEVGEGALEWMVHACLTRESNVPMLPEWLAEVMGRMEPAMLPARAPVLPKGVPQWRVMEAYSGDERQKAEAVAKQVPGAVARFLKAHPEVCEYMLWEQREVVRKEGRPVRRDDLPEAADAGRCMRFCAKREFVVGTAMDDAEERDGARTQGRVAALERLEGRLQEVMPAPLAPEEISCHLGAPWVPVRYVHDFMEEVLSLTDEQANWDHMLRISHSEVDGSWSVQGRCIPRRLHPEFAAGGLSMAEVLERQLNGRKMIVTRQDPKDPRRKVVDRAATAEAMQGAANMRKAWDEWVWKDPARAEHLAAIYNRRFNGSVARRYDGSSLTLPGHGRDVTMRRHQLDAVARVLQGDEGTLVAHCVGAGKTYVGVASCMEARRLGRAKKPLVVVPNHLTEQWAEDFRTLYPDAKVLWATERDKGQDAERRFWTMAASNDWDAVVVGWTKFDRLALSADRRKEHLQARLDEMSESIEHVKAQHGSGLTVKGLVRERARLQRQLDWLEKRGKTDAICWEACGFDMLVVDEAHYYKNLAVTGGLEVDGMSVSASAKCEGLLEKCDLLRDEGHGRNLVFLTGTPVSNSMAELYNMERYLAPGQLRSQGLKNFSQWALTFGNIEDLPEVRPEGSGFQVKRKFRTFENLGELMTQFHQYADLVTADMVKLDLPEVEKVTEVVEPSEAQRKLMEGLADRADRIRSGTVDRTEDNFLKITGDGRKLALDPKLLSPTDPDVEPMEGGKVARCAENVLATWRATEAQKGTQLVFCDTSTPASGRWNIYDDLKRRLVEGGMPAKQVAFVSDAGDDPAKRERLFERVRAGDVRVLVGSTQKLGVGTNVQDRLVATHDLDCPWRPADLEQRMGRIARQGNTNESVKVYRYVTKGTFDAFLYQTVEAKQRFISQVMSSGSPARSASDLDEAGLDYAEIKACATGDPAVQERLQLENDVKMLRLQRQAWERGTHDAKEMLPLLEQRASALEAETEAARVDEGTFAKALAGYQAGTAQGKEGTWPMSVEGVGEVTKRPAGNRAVINACKGCEERQVGSAYGVAVWTRPVGGDHFSAATGNYELGLAGPAGSVHWSGIPLRVQTTGMTAWDQMHELLEKVAGGAEAFADSAREARERADDTRARSEAPFPAAGELAAAQDRIEELELQRRLEEAQRTGDLGDDEAEPEGPWDGLQERGVDDEGPGDGDDVGEGQDW